MEYLTNTEELMMKCIWNYGKEMPFLRMGEELKDKFHKEYKRTSIRTYLFRLEDKGYIKVEKRGRKAYINALIDETTYKTEKAASMLDEWFDGSAKELFSALNQKSICICFVALKIYKELERMLKVSEIKMSVGKVLALAKTITTIQIKLPLNKEVYTQTMLMARHQKIAKLFDEDFWGTQ